MRKEIDDILSEIDLLYEHIQTQAVKVDVLKISPLLNDLLMDRLDQMVLYLGKSSDVGVDLQGAVRKITNYRGIDVEVDPSLPKLMYHFMTRFQDANPED